MWPNTHNILSRCEFRGIKAVQLVDPLRYVHCLIERLSHRAVFYGPVFRLVGGKSAAV
jgi:hypothetical protein